MFTVAHTHPACVCGPGTAVKESAGEMLGQGPTPWTIPPAPAPASFTRPEEEVKHRVTYQDELQCAQEAIAAVLGTESIDREKLTKLATARRKEETDRYFAGSDIYYAVNELEGYVHCTHTWAQTYL